MIAMNGIIKDRLKKMNGDNNGILRPLENPKWKDFCKGNRIGEPSCF